MGCFCYVFLNRKCHTPILWIRTGAFLTLMELHFLVIFALHRRSQGMDKGWKVKIISMDIETGILTFDSCIWISRLESRLLEFESWYQDRNRDSQILSLDIKTGIKTFMITVLTWRLVLKLKKGGGAYDQDSCESRFSSLHCTFTEWAPKLIQSTIHDVCFYVFQFDRFYLFSPVWPVFTHFYPFLLI